MDIALLRRIIFTEYQTSTMSKPYPEDLKWSKTCSLKHRIMSLLCNSTIGYLPYPQTVYRHSFRPIGLIAKPQRNNYTNNKIWSKTCPPKHTNRSDYIILPKEIVHTKFKTSWSYNKAKKGKLHTLNQKIWSKTCSLRHENRPLLHNSTSGHLL